MSRLKETSEGWQWDAGPVFPGPAGRKWAVEYGQTVQRLEDYEELAQLLKDQEKTRRTIEKLKEFAKDHTDR